MDCGVRRLRVAGTGRAGGRHLDREPQLGVGRHQEADAGQRRPDPDGCQLQDRLRGAQHRQRVAGDGLAQRHGLHQLVGARLETAAAGRLL